MKKTKDAVLEKVILFRTKDDPRVVVAKDTLTGRTAKARCTLQDTFDFRTGAAIALDRVMREAPKFNVGDVVRGQASANIAYNVTKENWAGVVTAVAPPEGFSGWPGYDFQATPLDTVVKCSSATGYLLRSEHFALVKRAGGYTGQLVCINVADGAKWWTLGKIYSCASDVVIDDDGDIRVLERMPGTGGNYRAGSNPNFFAPIDKIRRDK